MAKTKQDLQDDAVEAGLNLEALARELDVEGHDPDKITNLQLAEAIASVVDELPVTADLFIVSEPAGANVPLAGLLAHRPELGGETELRPSEWRTAIAEYLQTPTLGAVQPDEPTDPEGN